MNEQTGQQNIKFRNKPKYTYIRTEYMIKVTYQINGQVSGIISNWYKKQCRNNKIKPQVKFQMDQRLKCIQKSHKNNGRKYGIIPLITL